MGLQVPEAMCLSLTQALRKRHSHVIDSGGYKAMIFSGTSQHQPGDIRGDPSGAAWELLLAPRGVTAVASSHHSSCGALGRRMKSLKYTCAAQQTLMHLAPIRMLEEKRT